MQCNYGHTHTKTFLLINTISSIGEKNKSHYKHEGALLRALYVEIDIEERKQLLQGITDCCSIPVNVGANDRSVGTRKSFSFFCCNLPFFGILLFSNPVLPFFLENGALFCFS